MSTSSASGTASHDPESELTSQIKVSETPHPSTIQKLTPISLSQLNLQLHNDSFDRLLSHIPAKYYIQKDTPPPQPAILTKAQKKAAKKRSQQVEVKAAKSEAVKQAKLARYDPDEPKTIPEIQRAAAALALKKKGKSRAEDDDDASSNSWEDSEDSDDGGEDGEDDDEEEDSANETDFVDSDTEEGIPSNGLHHPRDNDPSEGGLSITGLRDKLQKKIAEIQAHKRGGGSATNGKSANEDSEATSSSKTGDGAPVKFGADGVTPMSKEELLDERRKQRGLVRDNRRRKRKAERKDEKPKVVRKEGERAPPSNGRKGGGKANAPPKEPREEREHSDDDERPAKKSKATPPTPKSAPVTSLVPSAAPSPLPSKSLVVKSAPATVDASSLSFSTLDFSTTALLAANSAATLGQSKAKKNRHALPKDPNAALEVLAKRKAKLDELNPEQRERKEEKDRWEKVALKAGGEKVRDDEKRLKKMAKRQEKIKSKSAKAWAERKETVSSSITAKIAKRNNNIAARAKQVKEKKMGIKTKTKAVKTVSKSFKGRDKGAGGAGKARAGFEGKKAKAKK